MGSSSRSRFRYLIALLLTSSAAVSLAALLSAAAQRAAERPKLTLGVLRRDGLLVPFASFDHDWSVSWPQPGLGRVSTELPISLADVPRKWWGAAGPDAGWTVWLADGETRPLTLVKPVVIPVFCSTRLVVATDYVGGPFQRQEPTVPKDGLAIAGNARLLPIDNVSVHSADAGRLRDLITADFNKEETAAAGRFTRWKHPFPAAQRQKIPIEIEAFYRASEEIGQRKWTTSYVEAVRKYPPGPKDRDCGLVTFAQAWIRERPGAEPDVDLGAHVTYCDRADAAFIQPFGRLHLGDDVYWVYQTSSWTDELYTISRMTPKEVRPVVVVSGGHCER
ncbi:MAG TPA: hypothetical protein VH458_23360 [Vicinamibacterales bacterium]